MIDNPGCGCGRISGCHSMVSLLWWRSVWRGVTFRCRTLRGYTKSFVLFIGPCWRNLSPEECVWQLLEGVYDPGRAPWRYRAAAPRCRGLLTPTMPVVFSIEKTSHAACRLIRPPAFSSTSPEPLCNHLVYQVVVRRGRALRTPPGCAFFHAFMKNVRGRFFLLTVHVKGDRFALFLENLFGPIT